MLIINFEGREAKGLSEGRYDETVAGEDVQIYNSYLASGDFCPLLITFPNSLDPDQDHHNVGPNLNPNRLAL